MRIAVKPGQYRVFGVLKVTISPQGTWSAGRMNWLVRLLAKAKKAISGGDIEFTPVAS